MTIQGPHPTFPWVNVWSIWLNIAFCQGCSISNQYCLHVQRLGCEVCNSHVFNSWISFPFYDHSKVRLWYSWPKDLKLIAHSICFVYMCLYSVILSSDMSTSMYFVVLVPSYQSPTITMCHEHVCIIVCWKLGSLCSIIDKVPLWKAK